MRALAPPSQFQYQANQNLFDISFWKLFYFISGMPISLNFSCKVIGQKVSFCPISIEKSWLAVGCDRILASCCYFLSNALCWIDFNWNWRKLRVGERIEKTLMGWGGGGICWKLNERAGSLKGGIVIVKWCWVNSNTGHGVKWLLLCTIRMCCVRG